jgi:hypothetical protein
MDGENSLFCLRIHAFNFGFLDFSFISGTLSL